MKSTTFVSMFVTVATLAATAACAEQSRGLGGAALPQEAASAGEAIEPAAAEPIVAQQAAQVDPSAALSDTSAVDGAPVAPDAALAPDAAVQPTPDRSAVAMSTAGDDLWKRIIPAMADMAGSRKPRHIPESMVYAADSSMTVVYAAAEGVDKLTIVNFQRGAVVGYVYLVAKKGSAGLPTRSPMLGAGANASGELSVLAVPTRRCCLATLLPQGLFGVRIVPDTTADQVARWKIMQDIRTKAQLIDAAGKVVQEMSAAVTEDSGTTTAPWAGVTIDRGGPLTLSVSSGKWKIDASRHIP